MCEPGFDGADCGQEESCPLSCCGNGKCNVKSNKCECAAGFVGKACNIDHEAWNLFQSVGQAKGKMVANAKREQYLTEANKKRRQAADLRPAVEKIQAIMLANASNQAVTQDTQMQFAHAKARIERLEKAAEIFEKHAAAVDVEKSTMLPNPNKLGGSLFGMNLLGSCNLDVEKNLASVAMSADDGSTSLGTVDDTKNDSSFNHPGDGKNAKKTVSKFNIFARIRNPLVSMFSSKKDANTATDTKTEKMDEQKTTSNGKHDNATKSVKKKHSAWKNESQQFPTSSNVTSSTINLAQSQGSTFAPTPRDFGIAKMNPKGVQGVVESECEHSKGNNCNYRGICKVGKCFCQPMWYGEACEIVEKKKTNTVEPVLMTMLAGICIFIGFLLSFCSLYYQERQKLASERAMGYAV